MVICLDYGSSQDPEPADSLLASAVYKVFPRSQAKRREGQEWGAVLGFRV